MTGGYRHDNLPTHEEKAARRDALQDAFLDETAPPGYEVTTIDTHGLNDPDGEVEAVYHREDDQRELRFPVDALMAGFTPDGDLAIIERALHERPDIAKRALEENRGAADLAAYIEERWSREMTSDKVREFASGLTDAEAFLESCLEHPDEDREWTDDELAEMGEA